MSFPLDDHLRARLSEDEARLFESQTGDALPAEAILILNWMLHEAEIEKAADHHIAQLRSEIQRLTLHLEHCLETQQRIVNEYNRLNAQLSTTLPTLGDSQSVIDQKNVQHQSIKDAMETLVLEYHELEPRIAELRTALDELDEQIENVGQQLTTDLAPSREKRQLLMNMIQYVGGVSRLHPRLFEILGVTGNPFAELGAFYREVLTLQEAATESVLISGTETLKPDEEEAELPELLPSPAVTVRRQRRRQQVNSMEAAFASVPEFFGSHTPTDRAAFLTLAQKYRNMVEIFLNHPTFAWISDHDDRGAYLSYYAGISQLAQPADLFVIFSERKHGSVTLSRALAMIYRHLFPEANFEGEEYFAPLAEAIIAGKLNGTHYWYENDCQHLLSDYLAGKVDLTKVELDESHDQVMDDSFETIDEDFEAEFAALLESEARAQTLLSSGTERPAAEPPVARQSKEVNLSAITIGPNYEVTEVPSPSNAVALRRAALWAIREVAALIEKNNVSVSETSSLQGASLDRLFDGGFNRYEDQIYGFLKSVQEARGDRRKVRFDYHEILLCQLIIRFEKLKWQGIKGGDSEKVIKRLSKHLHEISEE